MAARRPARRRLRILCIGGFLISIRGRRLWFRSHRVSLKRINFDSNSCGRSNSGSDGILSRDKRGLLLRSKGFPQNISNSWFCQPVMVVKVMLDL